MTWQFYWYFNKRAEKRILIEANSDLVSLRSIRAAKLMSFLYERLLKLLHKRLANKSPKFLSDSKEISSASEWCNGFD